MARSYYMPLDDHPEHAVALGRLLGHWAALETRLMLIMTQIIPLNDLVAYFIYNEFVNTKSKINLIQRLNNLLNKDDKLKKEVANLLARAQYLNVIRNDFVHGYWRVDKTDPTKLIRTNFSSPRSPRKAQRPGKRFTSQDIQDAVEKVVELCQSFDELLIPS